MSAGVDGRRYMTLLMGESCSYTSNNLVRHDHPTYGLTATKSGLQEIGTVPVPL